MKGIIILKNLFIGMMGFAIMLIIAANIEVPLNELILLFISGCFYIAFKSLIEIIKSEKES